MKNTNNQDIFDHAKSMVNELINLPVIYFSIAEHISIQYFFLATTSMANGELRFSKEDYKDLQELYKQHGCG